MKTDFPDDGYNRWLTHTGVQKLNTVLWLEIKKYVSVHELHYVMVIIR